MSAVALGYGSSKVVDDATVEVKLKRPVAAFLYNISIFPAFIAMISIQICYSVFGQALLDGTGVGPDERPEVEESLAGLYDALAVTGQVTT